MDTRAFLVLALLGPVAGLTQRKLRQETEVETEYIREPSPTLFEDIKEDWEEFSVRVHPDNSPNDERVPVTPAKMTAFPPLVVMTGTDRLSQGIAVQKAGHDEGTYETDFVKLLIDQWKRYGEKGNFLDVGANLGMFTLPLAQALQKHPESSIISVEVLPLNNHLLRASIKANNLKNVRLYEYALGNMTWTDEVRFNSGGPNSGRAAYAPKRGKVRVPATTLDSMMFADEAMKAVFAMKIDIEGTEPAALYGAEFLLANNPPCMVMAELNRGEQFKQLVEGIIEHFDYERAHVYLPLQGNKNVLFQQKNMDACIARLDALKPVPKAEEAPVLVIPDQRKTVEHKEEGASTPHHHRHHQPARGHPGSTTSGGRAAGMPHLGGKTR